jgi:hypothetical protein
MATKNTAKQAIEAIPAPVDPVAIATDIDLESAIADQLLDDIDWAKVRAAIIRKAPAKLFAWLTSSGDRPVNISLIPELQALPSSEVSDA